MWTGYLWFILKFVLIWLVIGLLFGWLLPWIGVPHHAAVWSFVFAILIWGLWTLRKCCGANAKKKC